MMSGGDRSEMSSFTFPAEWHDDERMNVMFAPFRDKATYLRSWEQKMKFWTKLISERCKACDELIIDSKMLPHLFMRKGKIPCGLDVVLTEMARSGRVQRLSEYETKNPTGWLSWGYNTFVKTPFVWSVNKLLLRSSNTECQEQFVLLEAVQAKGKELIQRHQSSMECSLLENIVELTTLKRKYKDMFKDDQTFNLVLKQLEKEKKIILFKVDNSATVVKFAEKHEAYVSPVRDIETKVFRIQQTSELLEKEAEILSSSVEKYTEEARMYLRKGLKSTALSVLRKKKKTQTLLDKKLSTLDIFHGLIENIKNTVSEKMVIEAYEVATSTLKGYMKTNKLSVDRVEDVMDNLHEVTQDQEEIATTIGNFQPSSWDMTQDDFEAELDSILAEDSPEKSSPTKPGRSLITPQPVEEMDDDYSSLEDRLRQLYNPNTSSTLPDVPMFEPSPVSSPGSPAKRVATREEEPMITS